HRSERVHHPLGRLQVRAVELLGARLLATAHRARPRARVSSPAGPDHLGDLGGTPNAPGGDAVVVLRHVKQIKQRPIARLADCMADGKRPSLEVEERSERGTRATKRLRSEGYVPGVVYGGDACL